jgi:hypothetical protein
MELQTATAQQVRIRGSRPWPFPPQAVRARESTSRAAVRRLRPVLVRRRASVQSGPLESGRCKLASGRSRQRPPRSGKGVRRSIPRSDGRLCPRVETAACSWKIEERRELYARSVEDQAKQGTKARAHPRRPRTWDGGRAEINSVCQVIHRKCAVHPQDSHRFDTIRPMMRSRRAPRWPVNASKTWTITRA